MRDNIYGDAMELANRYFRDKANEARDAFLMKVTQ